MFRKLKDLFSGIYFKIAFFVLGGASLIWFLIRVIPKPRRAGYPCMKAAVPLYMIEKEIYNIVIHKLTFVFLLIILVFVSYQCIKQRQYIPGENIPYLQKQGTATQLIVDCNPFLILGGEVGNSSASDPEYMRPVWTKLTRMNLNTVLAPVYWELIEPEEGRYNFTLVDSLIYNARRHKLRLVLLWFGSWKNSMSCYAPLWVKTNPERFPRARNKEGKGMEILSAFSSENMEADRRAFTALMQHIREADSKENTVIMVQVENEVGMIPEARDYSNIASKAFIKAVPQDLMDYLQNNKESLIPEFKKIWERNGYKTSGTWEDIFGKGLHTDEIFMAWHYVLYINKIAEAGKAVYPLPMYVNAALIRPGYKPGQYPSAGPLPHLIDIWRAGAPQIDFLSPDIYFRNFKQWCQKYHRSGNPLFIPEAHLKAPSGVNALYAIGQYDAIGFSPFSIESAHDPENERITKSYEILSQLAPLILEKQGQGLMSGILIDSINDTQQIAFENYTFNIKHEYSWKWAYKSPDAGPSPRAGGIIIVLSTDEFIIAGSGLIITFKSNSSENPIAGIGSIDEGKFVNGKWVAGRRMNGDQSHQGRHMQLPYGTFSIQRVRLYQYR